MGRYVLHRLAISVPLLLVITIITFVFINIAPGDPITAMISPEDQLQEKDLERMREALGLNQPLPVRYLLWLGQAAQGNLGYSYVTREPVLRRIADRVGPTLELMGVALLVSTVLGTLFGLLAAIHVYRFWDYFLTVASLFGLSIPSFFFALVALYIFAARLQVLPAFGMASGTGPPSLADNLYHLILPASVLSLELMASLTRYTRSAVLDALRSDYVTTARAKGLRETVVLGRHVLRNAALPLITVVALRIPYLMGGAIVIEFMFQWPGMGLFSIQAIQQRDYPVLMGLTLAVSILVLLSNLVADLLYAYADPRIRI